MRAEIEDMIPNTPTSADSLFDLYEEKDSRTEEPLDGSVTSEMKDGNELLQSNATNQCLELNKRLCRYYIQS